MICSEVALARRRTSTSADALEKGNSDLRLREDTTAPYHHCKPIPSQLKSDGSILTVYLFVIKNQNHFVTTVFLDFDMTDELYAPFHPPVCIVNNAFSTPSVSSVTVGDVTVLSTPWHSVIRSRHHILASGFLWISVILRVDIRIPVKPCNHGVAWDRGISLLGT